MLLKSRDDVDQSAVRAVLNKHDPFKQDSKKKSKKNKKKNFQKKSVKPEGVQMDTKPPQIETLKIESSEAKNEMETDGVKSEGEID